MPAKVPNFQSPCSLIRCIREKDIDAMELMIRKRRKKPIPLQENSRGWTALHIAASADEYADYLELLLRHKDTLLLDVDAETSIRGETALYLACERGCVKNCTILLENQCDPELVSRKYLETPLHIASEEGHVAIVSQLLACNVNVNCQDLECSTPLHLASTKNHLEVVRVLMTSKQTRVNIRDYSGILPLHWACISGAFEIVKILLEADRSLIDCQDNDGLTPLMFAIRGRCVKCVKYLLDHGANADQCTKHHMIGLDYAASSGNEEVLELALQATSLTCIREQFTFQIQSRLSTSRGDFESLIPRVIKSGSPKCMSVLLKFGLPKGILEAPKLLFLSKSDSYIVCSPIAYLFVHWELFCSDDVKMNQFLQLLLDYGITHMDEFRTMIELPSTESTLRFEHPFPSILELGSPDFSPIRYLNMLIEKGITTDYYLQYGVDREKAFQNFNVEYLDRFYEPVVRAINEDNAEFLQLLITNSAILEPSHLWQYLELRELNANEARGENVVNYLMTLVDSASEFANAWKIIDQYNLPVHSSREAIKHLDLRKICRNVLRKELRDVTLADNLKNFRRKIDALPIPEILKDFLHFKRR